MYEVQGTCDERFSAVRAVFAANFANGLDAGASVAVTLAGQPVVDLWAGYADDAKQRPWERDTIANVYSTTKTMTALCALILADRGELDFYAPVARYWPEFAANGKSEVQVRHLMSHSSGLSGWSEPMTVEDLYDWEKATSLLAAQAPWWEPGTASGYHAGLPCGRSGSPHHWEVAWHVLSERSCGPAGRGLPHRPRREPRRSRR